MRDYLCNRMYTLDEDRVESYLSQIVALAILRPSPALERLLLDFCSRSVRLACKVSARVFRLRNHRRLTYSGALRLTTGFLALVRVHR